jgi:hypothetical protein
MDLTKEMKENHILLNRIRTPDGTVLTSWSVHDFVTHVDENGHEYMTDGGNFYMRRNVVEDAPYEELSVYWTEDHAKNREVAHWGTYGKNGDQPKTFVFIKDMTTNHINAIFEGGHGGLFMKLLFMDELKYREEHGL